MITFGAIAFLVLLIVAIVLLTIRMTKQSKRDWATLKEFQDKLPKIASVKELYDFQIEFTEKSAKINNDIITPHLMRIQGSLDVLNKIYKL